MERKKMSEKGSKNFHFNVNVRTNTGSIARMTNNEESFSRAMEIQERKREKIEEEQKRLEAEKKAEEQAVTPEPVENDEGDLTAEAAGYEDSSETPVTQDEAANSPDTTDEAPVTTKAATEKPAPKPSGGGVSGPTSRAGQFTLEELDAMRKRAKAHAAKVRASKL